MPRATWHGLTLVQKTSSDHVEKILKFSVCTEVKQILSRYEKVRDLQFRPTTSIEKIQFNSGANRTAAAVQLRGSDVPNPCRCCQQGRGPFSVCIRIPDMINGCCANCLYMRESCTYESKPPKPQLVQHPTRQSKISKSRKTDTTIWHPPYPITSPRRQKLEKGEDTAAENSETVEMEHDLGDDKPPPTSPDKYVVLGDLVLPRPPPQVRALAEKFERHLRALDARNMNDLRDRPITNLSDSFRDFQRRECQSWLSSLQQDVTPSLLVEPSGTLQSSLAHRLNQPSYTTLVRENGQTADVTNACMATVMGQAYNPGETLVFDHVHRRDHESKGVESYHPDVLVCHEKFTDDIAQSMMAKVEIVWGLVVAKRLEERQSFATLPLWGEYEGVVLHLAYERCYQTKTLGISFDE